MGGWLQKDRAKLRFRYPDVIIKKSIEVWNALIGVGSTMGPNPNKRVEVEQENRWTGEVKMPAGQLLVTLK